MSSLQLDRYIPRRSPVHAADARVKFVLTIATILTISLMPVGSFAALAVAWVALCVLSMVAKLGALRLTRGSFFALPFVLAAAPLVFTKPGDPLFDIPLGLFTVTVSGEGLRMFLTIGLKSWVSVQAALLLTYTTPFPNLIEALRRLRLPALMVSTIGFMYRYLSVLADESTRMMRARAARAAELPGAKRPSVTWQAKVVGMMVGSLFLRAYERSERVYAAMQSRGFDGELRYLQGRALARTELGWMAVCVALLVGFEYSAHVWLPRL